MDDLPQPLVPADHVVSMLGDFRLHVDRLLASELIAIATPEECWAALMLWCRAWKQTPGGSLPNDDRALAGFSGAGRRWKKLRANALHGFVLCSDGRLYHPVLCEEVKRAYASHRANAQRKETDRKRLADWRAKHGRNALHTPDEARFVAEGTEPSPSPYPSSSLTTKVVTPERESRAREAPGQEALSQSDFNQFEVTQELIAEAAEARAKVHLPPVNLDAEALKFSLSRATQSPQGWMRWALIARPDLTPPPNGHDPPFVYKPDVPDGPPPPLSPEERDYEP